MIRHILTLVALLTATTMLFAENKKAVVLHFNLDQRATKLLLGSGSDTGKGMKEHKKLLYTTRVNLIKVVSERYPIIAQLNNQLSRAYKIHKDDKRNKQKNIDFVNSRLKLRSTIASTLRFDPGFEEAYNLWLHANMVVEDSRAHFLKNNASDNYHEYQKCINTLQEVRLGILGE